MAGKLGTYVRQLRGKAGLSQDYVAKKMGLSRPTYIQIEKGERGLTVSEAETLALLFDMSLDDFLKVRSVSSPRVFLEPSVNAKKKAPDIRISVPRKNLKKFKEVLLYLLDKVGAKPNIGETALYKLLYFIDFDYYEKFEEQLIGATYIKNRFGPTPVEFIKIVEDMKKRGEIEQIASKYFQYEQKKYLPLRAPDLSSLSAQEIGHINEVIARLSDKSAKELSDYSREDIPWKVHKQGEKISYESVFYRDHEHSVRNYEDEL